MQCARVHPGDGSRPGAEFSANHRDDYTVWKAWRAEVGNLLLPLFPPRLQASLYCPYSFFPATVVIVEAHPIEDRIKELCESAVTANDSEVPALFDELRALLAGHSEFVRYLAAKTLTRISQEPMQAQQDPSSAKAAD
jgi:hypothetical protein